MEKTMSRFDYVLKEVKETLRISSSLARMPLVIDALRTALEGLVREADDAIVLANDDGYRDGKEDGYHQRALEYPA